MTTQGDNETAINGRINTGSTGSTTCRGLGFLPSHGLAESWLPTNPLLPTIQKARRALPRVWPDHGLNKNWSSPNHGFPQIHPHPQPVSDKPWLRRTPGSRRGRPAGWLWQSSPLVGLGRPTVNCSFMRDYWRRSASGRSRQGKASRRKFNFTDIRARLTVNCNSVGLPTSPGTCFTSLPHCATLRSQPINSISFSSTRYSCERVCFSVVDLRRQNDAHKIFRRFVERRVCRDERAGTDCSCCVQRLR